MNEPMVEEPTTEGLPVEPPSPVRQRWPLAEAPTPLAEWDTDYRGEQLFCTSVLSSLRAFVLRHPSDWVMEDAYSQAVTALEGLQEALKASETKMLAHRAYLDAQEQEIAQTRVATAQAIAAADAWVDAASVPTPPPAPDPGL